MITGCSITIMVGRRGNVGGNLPTACINKGGILLSKVMNGNERFAFMKVGYKL